MKSIIPHSVDIDAVIANSFRDFHVKGFDYLCLRRSPVETIKLYFFDGDVAKLPEVVNPHDHRYPFETHVLAGSSENHWYARSAQHGHTFNRFEYRAPLNGGDGFTFAGEELLMLTRKGEFRKGGRYSMRADEIHTIRMRENETVLMLRQFEDVVPLNQPTQTFTRGDAPSLEGLYQRFTADQVVSRLRNFEDRTGFSIRCLVTQKAAA